LRLKITRADATAARRKATLKIFAISGAVPQSVRMTQPLARPLTLLLFERLLPGGQLVNRMQDLGYRVQTIADPATVIEQAEHEKPMLIMADLDPKLQQTCEAITRLKKNPATGHIPVIAFASSSDPVLQKAALDAGATLVVNDVAILQYLQNFLDQALQVP
jgi:CheY-like chemotaxis protein